MTGVGAFLARPIAFVLVGVYVVLWLFFDHKTFEWHSILTVLTLMMTLFIQRSEHRDMQAMQAKLDELLRAHGEARTELQTLDKRSRKKLKPSGSTSRSARYLKAFLSGSENSVGGLF